MIGTSGGSERASRLASAIRDRAGPWGGAGRGRAGLARAALTAGRGATRDASVGGALATAALGAGLGATLVRGASCTARAPVLPLLRSFRRKEPRPRRPEPQRREVDEYRQDDSNPDDRDHHDVVAPCRSAQPIHLQVRSKPGGAHARHPRVKAGRRNSYRHSLEPSSLFIVGTRKRAPMRRSLREFRR